MYQHFRRVALTAAFAVSLSAMQAFAVADQPNNYPNAQVAERGGGGGGHGGGGYHPAAHSDYHGGQGARSAGDHPNYNRDNFNRNNGDFNRNNEFNREGWDRNALDNAAWDAGGAAVVPEGEYVYPGTPTSTDSGDMDTLYDYESSNPNAGN